MKTVLIVDKLQSINVALDYMLSEQGYNAICHDTYCSEDIIELNPDLLIVNLAIDDNEGSELISKVKAKLNHIQVIIICNEKDLKEISSSGITNIYISKPFDIMIFADVVNQILQPTSI
ncbi:hypothetical protein [Mucilaginibacter lappiensis]|uniref:hypothetical protein n=1 Tax=Mucilaginibacter lappiensis TaxID=354630 RepID=UPI003D19A4D0